MSQNTLWKMRNSISVTALLSGLSDNLRRTGPLSLMVSDDTDSEITPLPVLQGASLSEEIVQHLVELQVEGAAPHVALPQRQEDEHHSEEAVREGEERHQQVCGADA